MKTLLPLLALAAPVVAQAVVVDFNSYAAGNLSQSSAWSNVGANFTVGAGGLSTGSAPLQALSPDAVGNEATAYYNTAFNPSTGALTVSAYFQYNTTFNSGGTPLTFGFSGVNDTNISSVQNIAIARIGRPGTDTGNIVLQNRVGGTSTNVATSAQTVTFTDANWYFYTATLTRTATPNTFSFSANLHNASADGTVGSVIASIGATSIANASLHGDTSVYVGMRGFVGNGLERIDNFEVSQIPEPSAYAAFLGFGALAFAANRRRRRSA